jgi:hypothetical protein
MIESLQSLAPGSRELLDSRLKGLGDRSALVRKSSASLRNDPPDVALITALGTALGDEAEEVREQAARSLCEGYLLQPGVISTLITSLQEERRRGAVFEALDEHFKETQVAADYNRVRGGLVATLESAKAALRKAASDADVELSTRAVRLLGRLAAIASLTRAEPELNALVPVVQILIRTLDHPAPKVRQEVLASLPRVSLLRSFIVGAVLERLNSPTATEEDRHGAFAVLAGQAQAVDSDPRLREALVPSIPLLIKALSSGDVRIREDSVQVLGYLGPPALHAEESLRLLASGDPQENVRKRAGDAIKAINGLARMPAPPRAGTAGMNLMRLGD